MCSECVEKTEPILADTHIYLLRVWSTLSEVQAYLQFFNDAAEYARKMVDGYTWVQRYWAAEQLEKGINAQITAVSSPGQEAVPP